MIPITSEWEILETLLLEQYKESPKYIGILQAVATEADRLEACLWEFIQLLDIDAMEGAQLDLLGKIAKCLRIQQGVVLDDVAYRVVLKAAFRARTSGTPEEIIAAVLDATQSTVVSYLTEYPAAYWLIFDGSVAITQDYLERISPAGVLPFQACYLRDVFEDFIVDANGDSILVVGPCVDASGYPADNVWDGQMGAIAPENMVFTDPWPFQDGTGIGEFPDGGNGAINPEDFTFLDGTYAEDTGG